jgi:serine-type D-Ala-D-Ala carboxypeptidase/endopeptidase (penicillin-binding protein 4)
MRHTQTNSNSPNGLSLARVRTLLDNGRMRRIAVLGVVLIVLLGAGVAGAQPGGTLTHRLAKALRVPQVKRGLTAALAVDLRTGRTLYQLHRSLPLEPASNEKLLVTYAALVRLGTHFRFHTDVLGQGRGLGRTWHGSLVLKGYGDPTLTRHRLRLLVRQLRGDGIRRVTGNVVGDESFFDRQRTCPGWKAGFEYEESPPLSALTVDRDVYKNRQSAHPALQAAIAFKDALKAAGVKVRGEARVGKAWRSAAPLARVTSGSLLGILKFMDRQSDNYTAEMLLKQLGALHGKGSSAAGAVVVRHALRAAGIPMQGLRVADGSGLSTLDRVTARTLSALLQAAFHDPTIRAPFFSALAVSGKSGTLKDRLKDPPMRGHVHAKTGTTDEASALSGYVKRNFVFSVLHNGSPLATWWAKVAEDRFVTVLARAR